MTHEQLVRDTAEKMAGKRFDHRNKKKDFEWYKNSYPLHAQELINNELIPARIAVAMKSDGYKKGKEHTELLYQSQHSSNLKTNNEHMIYLGLKPTDNE